MTTTSTNGTSRNGHARTRSRASDSDRLEAVKTAAAAPPEPPPESVEKKPEPAPPEGRDAATGKFSRGNRFSRGRPRNVWTRFLARRRKLFLTTFDETKFCQVVETLFIVARSGDVAAIKLLFDYALGKPAPAPDPDGMDQDEWDRLQRQPGFTHLMRVLMDAIPPDLATTLAENAQPQDAEALQKWLAAKLAAAPMKTAENVSAELKARAAAAGRNC